MGWVCRKCGNRASFTEINTIKTEVFQEKESTRILGTRDEFTGGAPLKACCSKCGNKDIEWVEIKAPKSGIDYHLYNITNAQTQFEFIEPTVSYMFRAPHPALENESYGAAFCKRLSREGKLSGKITEIGSGSGWFARNFLDKWASCSDSYNNSAYCMLDLSPVLLQSQRNLIKPHRKHVSFLNADMLALPFEDGSVEGSVISNEVIADLESVRIKKEQLDVAASQDFRAKESLKRIEKYGISLKGLPENFYFNLGAIRFLEELSRAMASGSSASLVEYGVYKKSNPILLKHRGEIRLGDHFECSILFEHLEKAAESLGFRAKIEPLLKFLDFDKSVEIISPQYVNFLRKKLNYNISFFAFTPEMLKERVSPRDFQKVVFEKAGRSNFLNSFFALQLEKQ
ncbi:MAG: SAM-dependent methyltransferase [Candidatus Diapherotrites archaeon]|nr:SAM-dependent methyltransferase [Candidatus Diapherotrites archaeon]